MRVLIAEDESSVSSGLRGILIALGYDVVAIAEDGLRAVEDCRRFLPDVVVMDIEMPRLDGLSAAREIAPDPGTPVIILSAHGHPSLVDRAVQDGVTQYILKPVKSEALHAALQTGFALSRELRRERDKTAALEEKLRSRKMIERAKGILMTRRRLSEEEAFAYLQRQSQDRRVAMVKLAESIIQADELFQDLD